MSASKSTSTSAPPELSMTDSNSRPDTPGEELNELVVVGRVRRPTGIKGTLLVEIYSGIPDRFILEAGCRGKNIPLVSAAIGGEAGQATIIFPGDPGLNLVYGQAQKAPAKGVERSLGTLPYAAVTMAAIECAAVVSYIMGKPPVLKEKLLFVDLSDYTLELLQLS